MSRLTIELVPKSCWYTNVRSNVSQSEWDKIRKECYSRAVNRCEVCGGLGRKMGYRHNVECHEIWHYDDKKHIQRLDGLICLCPPCHKVKHYGFAQMSGNEQLVRRHIKEVNFWTDSKLDDYLEEVFRVWEERSKHEWTLDISYLDTYLNDDVDNLMNRLKSL